ncbi:MAG: hypothetical protein ACK5C3_08010 [bacterium]|jgi:hypothetical protein
MNWFLIPSIVWTMLPYTSGALALLAFVLAWRAIRGTQAGLQPVCRRCEHDLRGSDPSRGNCTECGADLTRSGAVRTGRRVWRASSIVAALVALGVLGTALWWLTPTRVARLRANLIMSMPFQTLVDTRLSGLADPESALLAAAAIDSLVGRSAPRKLASGALLDAVLKSIARAGEPGRRTLDELLEGEGAELLKALDRQERDRLLELAAKEIANSGARNRDLARCLVAAGEYGGGPDASVTKLAELLRQSEAGRAALASKLVANTPATAGGSIALELVGPLDDLKRFPDWALDRNREALVVKRAEATAVHAASDAPQIELRVSGEPGRRRTGGGADMPALAADLKPGVYRLRVQCIAVQDSRLPKRQAYGNRTIPDTTAEDAAKLEGARAIDQTLTIEVVAPPPLPPPIGRATESAVVEALARWLANSRFVAKRGSGEQASLRLEFGTASAAVFEDAATTTANFVCFARQHGNSARIDSLAFGGGEHNWSGKSLPSSIDASQPFEVVLDPTRPADSRDTAKPRFGGTRVVWARYTLRFPHAKGPPAVTVEELPDTPVEVAPLARDDARAIVRTSIERAHSPEALARASQMSGHGLLEVKFGAVTAADALERADTAQPPVVLSGTFELRSGGALVTPLATGLLFMGPEGEHFSFQVHPKIAELYPYTLRYAPNPTYARARIPVSFRYIAEPFELRYANASTPPELVWVED